MIAWPYFSCAKSLHNIPLIYRQETEVLSTLFCSWEFLICMAQCVSDTLNAPPCRARTDKLLLSQLIKLGGHSAISGRYIQFLNFQKIVPKQIIEMKSTALTLVFISIAVLASAQSIPITGNQYHYYGPNSTWGDYLKVGGNGRETTNASVVTTNGNLHLDSKDGKALYLNHYSLGHTYINSKGGNVYFNTSDPDNAGLRLLFDKSTNNNGVDVDLTINSNSGSPIVDWYVRNWGGHYTFNRGSSNGKTKLFEINTHGNVYFMGGKLTGKNSEYISLGETNDEINLYSGGVKKLSVKNDYFELNDGNLYLDANDLDNAGLRVKLDKSTNNNGADVDLTIRTNGGSPIVDWNIRNWGGSYTFNRQMSNGAGGEQTRNLFRIDTNGNIIVPQGNAIIDGKVSSEEVKVEVLDIPDYVFEPEYELRTLRETKKFISKNKHLPEIPSEKEILANGGIDLGEMNMKLLKKIEELTLYQIELMEKLEEQQKRIEKLENK